MTDQAESEPEITRRGLLKKTGVAAAGIGSIAGCSEDSEPSSPTVGGMDTPTESETVGKTPAETDSSTASETQTPTQTGTDTPSEKTTTPELSPTLTIETVDVPEIPGFWSQEDSLEDLIIELKVTGSVENRSFGEVTVEDENKENEDEEVERWDIEESSLEETVEQNLEEAGSVEENRFKATSEKWGIEDQTTAGTQLPDEFLLDLQPANNENSNDPVFTTYSSLDTFTHDKKEIDLNELENWHDNDWENIAEPYFTVSGEGNLVEELGNSNSSEEIKNNGGAVAYPNSNPDDAYEYGSYVHDDTRNGEDIGFANATSYKQGQKWIKPLMFNFEDEHHDGAISTKDEHYAAFLQEAFDQHTDVDIHAWAFDLPRAPRSTHGNGLVWDETNDELRILETVINPVTDDEYDYAHNDPVGQQSPLIEDSNYLPPELRDQLGGQTSSDNTAYQEWWHPLRFNGEEPEKEELEFEDGKEHSAIMFEGIATGYQDSADDGTDGILNPDQRSVGLTTQYLTDIVNKLRNYNHNSFSFEQLKNQSKVYEKLQREDKNYIIGGTTDTPLIAETSVQKAEQTWSDPDGTLVDYVDELDQETYDELVSSSGGTPSVLV